MICPGFEDLFGFARNQLPSAAARNVTLHLSRGCRTCWERLRLLESFLSVVEKGMLVNPPEWLLRQAAVLFESYQNFNTTFKKPTWGLLVQDSWSEDILVGFRQTRRLSRQLLYRAGEFDVDLDLHPTEKGRSLDIIGQANPLSGESQTVANAPVELRADSTVWARVYTNQFGVFFLDETGEGTYDLIIHLPDAEIWIPGIEVQMPLF